MISDNVLGDRLNAFKKGEPLPEPESEEILEQLNTVSTRISHIAKISYEIINLSFVFLKSLAFGMAINTVFATGWEFWPIMAVGFSIQTITSSIFNLFNK